MKENRRQISIKRKIMLVFICAMLLSISGIGALIFTSWFASARQTTESIAESISENIYKQIESFMNMPHYVNQVNHQIIENGIFDMSDEKKRDPFFVGVLSTHSEPIYSFSYGTVDGEYYGARRNENGVIEIMRNNTETKGSSWYYSVKEDLTANELVVQAGPFDPRGRPWYQAAEAVGGPAFSPVYKHFMMEDLTVSAAEPVYDENGQLQGVMGTHMLLSDIGRYLEEVIHPYHGYAIIFEEETGALIANSMGIDNFTVLADSTTQRNHIGEIENSEIHRAYEYYQNRREPHFLYASEKNGRFYIDILEIHSEGLDWILVSAIPEKLLLSDMFRSIYRTILLTVLALGLSIIVYHVVIKRLFLPIRHLLHVSEALSSGDLLKRAEVVRNDEIGGISVSLNKVAEKMAHFIHHLEAIVKERTKELHKANETLKENKNQLQLILDSAAEAIFGVDVDGNCTFCNPSCIRLLGYKSHEELLGENMHEKIHHSDPDGTPFPIEKCRIYQSIRKGKGFEAQDEVFWRADGTSFDVEYHAYPQIKNGEVVGGVITFMDITERKRREREIEYLNCHDILTGLPNRRCFEENMIRIDTPENLPLSVIFADINGLKMTNDIFGHGAGDKLIKKSAEILVQSCREHDAIARIGGDEFIILLPKTNKENAKKVLSRIRTGFIKARVEAIKCSISLGIDAKSSVDQSMEEIMANAENAMYKDKTMNRHSNNKEIIDTLVNTLHSKSSREKRHSEAVRELCGEIGAALRLSEPQIDSLKRAGYLHDIGKIVLDENTLTNEALTEEESEKMRQHPVVGYRILSLFDDTLDLAEYVYSHHERWDGKGYPKGLQGEQIPRISRIISIVETYERIRNRDSIIKEERIKAAIEEMKEGAGKQFDPAITESFVRMMEKKEK